MAALCRSYTSHAEALDAVNAVLADADREQVVSYPGGVEHARVAGHHKIKKLLTDAGLDEATAERDVNALHAGSVLVLVTPPAGEAERVGTLLAG